MRRAENSALRWRGRVGRRTPTRLRRGDGPHLPLRPTASVAAISLLGRAREAGK